VLALKRLGRLQEALDRAGELLSYGEGHMQDEPEIDYFAVSYPDILVFEEDFVAFYRQHCKFMVALGYMGLSRWEDAGMALDEILAVNRYHIGAFLHRLLIHAYLPMLDA
jgi:hypothetical protein